MLNREYDVAADSLHPEVKEKFLAADKAFFEVMHKHLNINQENALRSVKRQAELYIDYNIHRRGNPADKPGYSIHNYGIAVDMVMGEPGSKEEEEIIKALEANGWERTHQERERWHFDCVDTKAYQKANVLRSSMIASDGLSTRWFATVKAAYQAKNLYDTEEPKMKDFSTKLELRKQEGLTEIEKLKTWEVELQNKEKVINEKIASYNELLGEFKKLHEISLPIYDEFKRKSTQVEEMRARGLKMIQELQTIEVKLKELINEDHRIVDEINRLISQHNSSSNSSERQRLSQEINRLKEGELTKVRKAYSELSQTYSVLAENAKNHTEAYKKLFDEVKRLSEVIENYAKKLEAINTKINILKSEVDSSKPIYEAEVQRFQSDSYELQVKVEQFKKDVIALEQMQINLQQQKNVYEESFKLAENLLTEIEKKVEEFKQGIGNSLIEEASGINSLVNEETLFYVEDNFMHSVIKHESSFENYAAIPNNNYGEIEDKLLKMPSQKYPFLNAISSFVSNDRKKYVFSFNTLTETGGSIYSSNKNSAYLGSHFGFSANTKTSDLSKAGVSPSQNL